MRVILNVTEKTDRGIGVSRGSGWLALEKIRIYITIEWILENVLDEWHLQLIVPLGDSQSRAHLNMLVDQLVRPFVQS